MLSLPERSNGKRKEKPMRTEYFITMDTHCRTTDVCVKTARGKLVKREHLSTGIPQLREVIESVPRPRRVAFEEGSLAGWLSRNLKGSADELVVCDPRRNAHVAKDGDKDDHIDAEKLNDLYRGGFLKVVHQLDSASRAATKQLVGMYHERVRHRVAEGNVLLALGKRWGVMLRRSELLKGDGQASLKSRLVESGVPGSIQEVADLLWQSFDRAVEQEQTLYRQVCALAKEDKMMRRVAELPGYGPVRAATLISYLDTPWRFKSKSALWKYVGIGLHRKKSGEGLDIICVEQACSHLLRNVVIGGAQSAIEAKENVFARGYARWIRSGLSARNARRNVARQQVTAIWAMWKSDKAFDASLLGDRS
jgi:transposase